MDKNNMFGKYRLEKIIGKGAVGRVYQAVNTETEKVVALKELISGENADISQIIRFWLG